METYKKVLPLIAVGFVAGMLLSYGVFPRERTVVVEKTEEVVVTETEEVVVTEEVEYDPEIHITSLDDEEEVHSKVWIDASFPEGTYAKEVFINGTFHADYTPYLWNNILARAGRYVIKVRGHWRRSRTNHTNNGTSQKEINITIPLVENFTGDRNNFTEDHVIHAGQNVTWMNGHFNLSSPNITNGAGMYETHWLDIFGNLTMINVTLTGVSGGNEGGVGTDMSRVNVRGNGILTLLNCDFHGPEMESRVICLFDNATVNSTNSNYSEVRYIG